MDPNMHPPEISDFLNDHETGLHFPPTFYTEVFDEIEDQMWPMDVMHAEMLNQGFKP